jgi:hypothetical protein
MMQMWYERLHDTKKIDKLALLPDESGKMLGETKKGIVEANSLGFS